MVVDNKKELITVDDYEQEVHAYVFYELGHCVLLGAACASSLVFANEFTNNPEYLTFLGSATSAAFAGVTIRNIFDIVIKRNALQTKLEELKSMNNNQR